jgi:hypothetical protein
MGTHIPNIFPLPEGDNRCTYMFPPSAGASQLSKLMPIVDSVSGGFHIFPEAVLSGMSRTGPYCDSPSPCSHTQEGAVAYAHDRRKMVGRDRQNAQMHRKCTYAQKMSNATLAAQP